MDRFSAESYVCDKVSNFLKFLGILIVERFLARESSQVPPYHCKLRSQQSFSEFFGTLIVELSSLLNPCARIFTSKDPDPSKAYSVSVVQGRSDRPTGQNGFLMANDERRTICLVMETACRASARRGRPEKEMYTSKRGEEGENERAPLLHRPLLHLLTLLFFFHPVEAVNGFLLAGSR